MPAIDAIIEIKTRSKGAIIRHCLNYEEFDLASTNMSQSFRKRTFEKALV
jgi:hypothetical protein